MATLRELAGQLGIKIDWDPATQQAAVGGQAFAQGQVPGTYFDPATGQHIINDETIFRSTFAPQTMVPTGVAALSPPAFTAAQPSTISTQPFANQINQYMQSPLNAPNYTPTDLSGLQGMVDQYQQQYGQGPFNQQGLMDIITGIQGMQAPDMRYQTPEQIQQLQQVWQQAMQPNMDAQQQMMQRAYQQALGQITNQRAGQGLLGGPATERMMADQAGQYGLQSGALQAQTAMDALLQAFNYAQLGLQEQGQNFGQNLSAQQAAMSGYGSGLGMQQEGAGNSVNMLAQLLGMREGQGQFGAGLDLSMEQMRQMQQQFGLGQQGNILGLDIGQNQWGQDFSQQSLRDQYNQWAGTEGLNIAQSGLTGQYGGAPTLAQKQFDLTKDLGLAGMTGQLYGQDTMDMQKMIAAATGQFQGKNTMDFNSLMASLSGVNPYTGTQTWGARQDDRNFGLDQAGVTGMYGGKPTLQREQLAFQQGLEALGIDRTSTEAIITGMLQDIDDMKDETPAERQTRKADSVRQVRAWQESGLLTEPQATKLVGMVTSYMDKAIADYAMPKPGWWDQFMNENATAQDWLSSRGVKLRP